MRALKTAVALICAISLSLAIVACASAPQSIEHQGAGLGSGDDKMLGDPSKSAPPSAQPTDGTRGISDDAVAKLQTRLKGDIVKLKGKWAVYVKDLKTGASIEINNNRMRAASLIKLFVMARVFYDLDVGNLKASSKIDDYLKKMITVSHSESTNSLVKLIGNGSMTEGMKLVNSYATELGFADTKQQRDLRDSRPVPIKEENWTSVADCGRILEMIYNGELVSKEASKEMLDLLLAQTRTSKIPAGLPKGVKVANKTGELGSVENDVAIVFAGNDDYILCIMSDELTNTTSARASIKSISTTVYKALGGTEPP